MRKVPLLLTSVLAATLLFFACKKGGNSNGGGPEGPTDYPTADVQVTLPEGASVDLSKTTLFALSINTPVGGDGKSKVPLNPGTPAMAYLFDESKNILMMSLISDNNREISVRTTAQALLHQALYLPWLPDTATAVFLNKIQTNTSLNEYYTEIEQAFKSDPQMLQKRTFKDALQKVVTRITEKRALDIYANNVYVENNEVKSQMSIQLIDDQNVRINNAGERRGHAFIYKTRYRTKSTRVELLKDISGSTAARKDIRVLPASNVKEVVGEYATTVNYTSGSSDAINLPLESGEVEATFKIRVVGVGEETSLSLTNAEEDKIEELYSEIFALDLLMPLMLQAEGQKGFSHDFNDEDVRPFVDKTKAMLASLPEVVEHMKEGEFTRAINSFLNNLHDQPSHIWEELAGTLLYSLENAKSRTKSADWIPSETQIKATVADMGNVLELKKYIIDNVKNHNDLKAAIAKSNQIEEWEVIAKNNDVEVSPKQSSVTTLTNHPLTVTTSAKASGNQSLVYKWTTAGKFGVIKAGSSEGKTVETDQNSVNYYGIKPSTAIDDNNVEIVYVTVYIKEGSNMVEVGTDTATINIKKNKLQMTPSGVTLAPGTGGQTSVRLYLKKPDGTNDIVSNRVLDYKVVWSTDGRYGKFEGSQLSISTLGNAATYIAEDDEARNALENITARVYFKLKKDATWTLREEVKGSVKIDNDKKKRILNVALSCEHGDEYRDNGNSMTCMITSMVKFADDPNAESYNVRFYDVPWPANYGWTKGKPQPNQPYAWVYTPGSGEIAVEFASTWTVGAPSQIPVHNSCTGNKGGMAEITIIMK